MQTIPGIREDAAAVIIAEAGVHMEQFPSTKHFSSSVGVCPGNNKSADIEKAGHTTKGNAWLRAVIVESAWSASMKIGSYSGPATRDFFRAQARSVPSSPSPIPCSS